MQDPFDKAHPNLPALKKGFGYFDASEYEPKADNTAWLIKNIIPKGIGFIAGPPKASASPHGGKSVLVRKIALSIITGKPFFGHEVIEQGRVMFMNLDENQDKQVRLYYRMTGGNKIPGYLISEAKSVKFPQDISKLESDIIAAKPKAVSIDPLLRTINGKDVGKQMDMGPIINELKRLFHEHGVTIMISHHSNKSKEREKEDTSSWLSGSVDLDSAWDFCLCVEYDKKKNMNHVRNFQKEKPKTDFFYEAIIDQTKPKENIIVDLMHIPEELAIMCDSAKVVYKAQLQHPTATAYKLSKLVNLPESTVRDHLANSLKDLLYGYPLPIKEIEGVAT